MLEEVRRAEKEHPNWPDDELRRAVVLAEEANECVKAQLSLIEGREKLASEVERLTATQYLQRKSELIKINDQVTEEAIQAGAMAIRFLFHREINGQAEAPQAQPNN